MKMLAEDKMEWRHQTMNNRILNSGIYWKLEIFARSMRKISDWFEK